MTRENLKIKNSQILDKSLILVRQFIEISTHPSLTEKKIFENLPLTSKGFHKSCK